jgi:hypothetical protein
LKGVDFKKVMLHSVGNTDIPEQIDSFETYMFDYVKGGTLWKD